MTSSVLIKFASSGFVRQAIEMLFESQKDCILANVNQTTIILQMVKSLIFYNLFDRESARVFSVAFKGDSLYNKLLLAKAYPTTPPSMTTVTLNNIKIWVAYPLKTIDKWFSEIVKTIKELTHSRFLELVTFIEPEHFHNELSTALIDYVNPSPNGKLSFEFGCSLLKIFANRGIRQNTFVLFVFEQMAKRFNNLHILDKKKLLNFAI